MKVPAAIGGLFLALCVSGSASGTGKPAKAQTCAPSGDLKFLCGMDRPEDLVVLPGGRWIVASGMSAKSGLHLIDGKTKKWQRWIAPPALAPQAPYAGCPAQSPPDELQLHGIAVRDRGNGRATLYAVNHGGSEPVHDFAVGRGRETIELFDIDMTGAKPVLSWAGCVPMPGKLFANSVVSAPDGSIFVTVMLHPGNTPADLWKGVVTGAVYKWTPGSTEFKRVLGTEMVGNNGIEISPDGETLYVTSLSAAVTAFTNSNPATKLNSVDINGVIADNIHWVGDRLIVGGSRTDLCPEGAISTTCIGGYFVSAVDPVTLAVTPLVKGPANPAFKGVSYGLPVGKTLWLGTYADDKLAYRLMP